jgi:endonuclease/exonuclease/phosphatase family metal-dependent hydrolase
MKKTMILLIKMLLALAILFGLYVIGAILYAQFTNYTPQQEEPAEVLNPAEKLPKLEKDTLVFYDWNIGYCGLGKESDFFYDGGKMVRPSKEISEKNLQGVLKTVQEWKNDADFINLQEVDQDSKRSYHVNQFQKIAETLGNYKAVYGKNYDVKFVVMPFLEPMGKVLSGIATFYKYQDAETPIKYAFPSNFSWPKGLFFLDRCFVKHSINLKNGKQLVVINTHNSAYDGGKLKKQEMAYFKKYITDEYAKGNYVVVGGDWNQIPPGYTRLSANSDYEEMPVPPGFAEPGWIFAFDGKTPTNRKVDVPYQANKTYTTVIDFFLLSPNIELLEVKGMPNGFEYSDHQPVRMMIKLKE